MIERTGGKRETDRTKVGVKIWIDHKQFGETEFRMMKEIERL